MIVYKFGMSDDGEIWNEYEEDDKLKVFKYL